MRQREIGGYIEFERFGGEAYHRDAVALNSGRGCLAYLVELRKMQTVWLPDFMCDSVAALLQREGVSVKTYPVMTDFLPDYKAFVIEPGEWLMLMDYYGQLKNKDVEKAYAFADGNLFVDETQGFFRASWEQADTLYTCRKWFGVADGGYLATRDGLRLDAPLDRDESHDRMAHVLGRIERPAGEFFAVSKANNEIFATEPAKAMSPVTENIMRAIPYEAVKARRSKNWDALHAALDDINGVRLSVPECAFMYPLYLENDAQMVRADLIAHQVFVPMLWPNVPEECDSQSAAYKLATNILPLPVDQRYNEEDMTFMIQLLENAIC